MDGKKRPPERVSKHVEIMMSLLLTIDLIWSDRVQEHFAGQDDLPYLNPTTSWGGQEPGPGPGAGPHQARARERARTRARAKAKGGG